MERQRHFAQTFIGAVLVTVVGGLIVAYVRDNATQSERTAPTTQGANPSSLVSPPMSDSSLQSARKHVDQTAAGRNSTVESELPRRVPVQSVEVLPPKDYLRVPVTTPTGGGSTQTSSEAQRHEAVLPAVTPLKIRPIDPHTCDKPDGAYYGRWGPAVPAPAGSGALKNPEFLFDIHNEDKDTEVNWANGFKGRVPICFVVDDRGNPTDIRFPQSPGADLEQHMKTKISGWRYKPGTVTRNWRDEPRAILVQLAFEFVFR